MAALAVAAGSAACSEGRAIVGPPVGELALGTWGGAGAGVIVLDSLTHVHVGCTFGDIQGRVKLDANGRFQVAGTYVLRAYPIVLGPELPATFIGEVRGKSLTLRVAVNDTTQGKTVQLGPVNAQLGTDPQLGPCPICTVPGSRLRAMVPAGRREGT
jgi:hypothetical protein